MSRIRPLLQRLAAQAVSEGAGVTVHRTIGTPALKRLDPFLMLDHFGSNDPDDYIAGFPDHPHRGFITLTYMLDGHMQHRDSLGNTGELRAGGVQWMKAASGVIHSEMPQQKAGLMRGFQLWINLPAREKMSDPEYQEFQPERIPQYQGAGQQVKIICGEYAGRRGPIQDPHTEVSYFDIAIEAGARCAHPVPAAHRCFAYVFEGSAETQGETLATHTLAVFGDGDTVELQAGSVGTRLILVAGRPLNEPVVQYGPFVMNTQAEIETAFMDYRSGTLVKTRGTTRA